MGQIATSRVVWLAALGLTNLLVLSLAYAAPPQNRPIQNQSAPQHLDLSAPSGIIEQSSKSGAFRSLASNHQAVGSEEHLQLPALGSEGMHVQPTMEERVQQFRREGLPVARLWENHSALVHMGLNQKGKPGLWIIQKLH
jgi:hypothetical protein